MAKPGKKKKVLFVLEIIVLLLFIGGLYVYGQISSRLDKIEQPELIPEGKAPSILHRTVIP